MAILRGSDVACAICLLATLVFFPIGWLAIPIGLIISTIGVFKKSSSRGREVLDIAWFAIFLLAAAAIWMFVGRFTSH